MSGGGSGGGGGAGGSGNQQSCEDLVIVTHIGTPTDSCSTLEKGDVLSVELTQGSTSTVELLHGNTVMGGVGDRKVVQLRECLQKGVSYQATVINKNSDSDIQIRIEAK